MEVISDIKYSRSTKVTNRNQWLFLLNVNHHLIQLTTFQSHLNDPKHFRNLQHTERGREWVRVQWVNLHVRDRTAINWHQSGQQLLCMNTDHIFIHCMYLLIYSLPLPHIQLQVDVLICEELQSHLSFVKIPFLWINVDTNNNCEHGETNQLLSSTMCPSVSNN